MRMILEKLRAEASWRVPCRPRICTETTIFACFFSDDLHRHSSPLYGSSLFGRAGRVVQSWQWFDMNEKHPNTFTQQNTKKAIWNIRINKQRLRVRARTHTQNALLSTRILRKHNTQTQHANTTRAFLSKHGQEIGARDESRESAVSMLTQSK